MEPMMTIVVILILVNLASLVRSDNSVHHYKRGDLVPFYANKVGPFSNPSETYRYYDLAFCFPDHLEEKKSSLGEVLNGDCLVTAPYQIQFLVEKDSEILCKKKLKKEEVSRFRKAIANDYYLQMYFDDLPIWSFIGMIMKHDAADPQEYKYLVYTHLFFEILYNADQVIEITARSDHHDLTELFGDKEAEIEFRYSVKWIESNASFKKRMEKYTQSSTLPHHLDIHRASIVNSFVTLILLTGCLLTIYVRVLRRDIYKSADNLESADNQEETGWKSLHGDVFRFPELKSLFAAALGSGMQLLVVFLSILILGVTGVFYPYNRGALLTSLIIIHAVTFGVAGFTTAFWCNQLESSKWVRNLLLTGSLSSGPLILTFIFLNTVATANGSTAALPFRTVMMIFMMWFILALPLLLLGGIAGKHINAKLEAPCRTVECAREIPCRRWYRGILLQMAMAGLLPFSVIYVELYYIFASVWGHRIYTIYSMLCIVFILLLIMTAIVSVAFTYFQLAAEDHKWWWRSFLYGGSTGLYLYGYCFYYYFTRSDMNGLMQISFFFGYMACASFGMFLMLGAMGFLSSLAFVRYIYSCIKCD